MVHFQQSTQFKHWFFDSSDKIAEIRVVVNTSARERIKAIKLSSPEKGKKKSKSIKDSDLLTVDDELHLLSTFVATTSQLCSSYFGFPLHVEATAVLFLKRFFLAHSAMEYDASLFM